MLKWFRRYLAWLCLAMAAAGAAMGALSWMRYAHLDEVMINGRSAVAVIERAQSFARKAGSTFEINLAWKTEDGVVLRAEQVPITSAYADRIIADGVLLVPSAKIRYLAGDAARYPVVAEDAEARMAELRNAVIVGLTGLVVGLVGAVLFSGWRLREAWR